MVFGTGLPKPCMAKQTWERYSSTRPLFVHTNTPPARKNSGHQALGHSRGGLTTKIHACVDALGNSVRLILTGLGIELLIGLHLIKTHIV